MGKVGFPHFTIPFKTTLGSERYLANPTASRCQLILLVLILRCASSTPNGNSLILVGVELEVSGSSSSKVLLMRTLP